MSNRLTFSLASLILIFAIVAIPAMAHDEGPDGHEHPIITISSANVGDADGTISLAFEGTAPAEATFKIKVEFDVSVVLADSTPTIVKLYDATGATIPVGTSGTVVIFSATALDDDDVSTTPPANGTTFTSTVTLTDNRPDPTNPDVAIIEVQIADAAGAGSAELNLATLEDMPTFEVDSEVTTKRFHVVEPDVLPDNTVTIATVPAMPAAGAEFTAILTFTAPIELTSDDVEVTGATAADPVKVSDTTWTVVVTPTNADTDVTVGVADTVATGDVLTIEADTTGGTMTGDVVIASKGYAVLVNPGATAADTGIDDAVTTIEYDLIDLYEFFRDSGTIVLDGPSATAFGAVRMTEIMWGRDAALTDPTMSQWIEIQNTTAAAITVNFGTGGGWSLEFKEEVYDNSTADAVDRISNLGNPGQWSVPGSSGRSVASADEDQKELVSMVRKHTDARSHRSDGWEAAIRPSVNIDGARIANPGSAKRVIVAGGTAPSIDRSSVFISEIGNLADGSDWIELYNASDSAVNIKNWIISTVTAADVGSATDAQLTAGNTEGGGIDKEVVQFGRATYEDALKIPAKSYLLVTAADPSTNDLAVGINLLNTKVDRNPKENETTGQVHLYYVASGLKIPNEAALVILRNHHEREGRSANFRDVVNLGDYAGKDEVNVNIVGTNNDNSWNTEVWPLESTRKPGDREPIGAGANATIQRDIGKTNHWAHKDLWSPSPFTGLGYDRDISDSATTKGTPGYANGGGLEKIADLKDGDISISEIMYANGNGRIPQWIELYNSSTTRSVNLNGWDLEINNVDSEDVMTNEYINRRITLGDVKVLPNQTVLIVSTSGRNTGRNIFPSHRTIDLSSPDAFGRDNRLDPILSSTGFNIALYDKDDKFVDEVGNIDNNRRTNDDPAWALPDAETEDGRTSIIRRYDDNGDAENGATKEGWIRASDTNLAYLNVGDLYYGRATDISTPGFRGGGPLPVSLSKFRPERLDDGTIVVRWITESETNNAGFNILRSEKRNGEFTKLNTKLIAGQGTTSERTTYSFPDTSAKPNVVYYYQIQDVSLEGQVNTLATTHLRGNVSAAGKLTTTWGELKALQ